MFAEKTIVGFIESVIQGISVQVIRDRNKLHWGMPLYVIRVDGATKVNEKRYRAWVKVWRSRVTMVI